MREDKQPSLRINQGRSERKGENTLSTLTATRYPDRLGGSVHHYLRQKREAKASKLEIFHQLMRYQCGKNSKELS